MKRWIARISFLVVALGVVLLPSSTQAGGWAIATFDPLPTLTAGEEAKLGFTILQHGVTPVDGDTIGDHVGITVTDGDGKTTFFPSTQSGATGHYVGMVTVPEDGAVTLNAEMDWFGSSPAFGVDIAATDASGGWPAWIGVTLPTIGVACLAVLVADFISRRRSGRAEKAAITDIDVVVADPPLG